tara:strand:+ start:1423 stop:1785 length:363 start_codon:yes stop_codon:yes gene_type:complete
MEPTHAEYIGKLLVAIGQMDIDSISIPSSNMARRMTPGQIYYRRSIVLEYDLGRNFSEDGIIIVRRYTGYQRTPSTEVDTRLNSIEQIQHRIGRLFDLVKNGKEMDGTKWSGKKKCAHFR